MSISTKHLHDPHVLRVLIREIANIINDNTHASRTQILHKLNPSTMDIWLAATMAASCLIENEKIHRGERKTNAV
jgi:hypothetical protein